MDKKVIAFLACLVILAIILISVTITVEILEGKIEKQQRKIDKLKEINLPEKDKDILIEITDKKVNKQLYYIRNEIMYQNKELTIEQAAYKAFLYYKEAKKNNIHPYLVLSVAIVESNCSHKNSISSAGAIGEMQIMPDTARIYNINPEILEENIKGGVKYLADLIDGYNELENAIAHYNGGSNPYYKKVHYTETKTHLKKVINIYESMKGKY